MPLIHQKRGTPAVVINQTEPLTRSLDMVPTVFVVLQSKICTFLFNFDSRTVLGNEGLRDREHRGVKELRVQRIRVCLIITSRVAL